MGAKTVLFFSSSMALLVTLSVLLNFWLYVLITFAAVIVIISFAFYRHVRNVERERRWASSTIQKSEPIVSPRYESTEERQLRNKVEEEWDRQSAFGSPEDLR